MSRPPVLVVGAGISGIACARRLADAGIGVRVLDRGHRGGGRMAVRTEQIDGRRHPIDVGASYLTVSDPGFEKVVASWAERGLARPWTDTLHLGGDQGLTGTRSGPMRWASPGGLRSLVEDLAAGLDVTVAHEVAEVDLGEGQVEVDGEPARAVVLAMPDPQAADLLPQPVSDALDLGGHSDWVPSVAVWSVWGRRWWPDLDGVFVSDSATVTFVADDGRRRGDDAAVLVAHVAEPLAAANLDAPGAVVAPVLEALPRLLTESGRQAAPAEEPLWAGAHRWSLSRPRDPHDQPFGLYVDDTGGIVGCCGDGWGDKPRIQQAWRSGDQLGADLVERLG